MKDLLDLFKAFFKIGIMTFGGGLAMLPMLKTELIEKNHWITEDELINYYAIGQCTPGIIAVNTATFVGFKQKKLLGAIFATLGIITPSLIIIICLAAFIQHFIEYKIVQTIFSGIRIAVAALVTQTVISLIKKGVKSYFGLMLFLLAFGLSAVFSVSPIILVLSSILIGIIGFKLSLIKIGTEDDK